jgi:hypothetical protein
VIVVKFTRVDCADSFEQVVLLGLGFRVEGLGVMVVDVEQVDFHKLLCKGVSGTLLKLIK